MQYESSITQIVGDYRRQFSHLARRLGELLFAGRQVRIIELGADRVVAVVSAMEIDYRVELLDVGDPTMRRFRCGCRPASSDPKCAHAWALLLTLSDDRIRGEVDAVHQAAEPSAAGALQPVAPQPQSNWRRRLFPVLVGRPEDQKPIEQIIEYHVQIADEPEDVALTIAVRSRRRLKNGGFGVTRGARISRSEIARMPSADRDLLTMMERDSSELYDLDYYPEYYGRHSGKVALASRWMVHTVDLPTIMPRLAAAGRVFDVTSGEDERSRKRLQVDGGEPFVLQVAIADPVEARERMSPTDMLTVAASVVRGEERIALDGSARVGAGVVMVGDRIVRLASDDPHELARELGCGAVRVSRDELPELLSELSVEPGASRFLEPILSHIPCATPTGVAVLTFPQAASAEIELELCGDYDGTLIPLADPRVLVSSEESASRRDPEAESQLRAFVLTIGAQPLIGERFTLPRAQLLAATSALHDAGYRVIAEGRKVRSFVTASGRVSSGIDWLEVATNVTFDGYSASLPVLLRKKSTPEGFVELDDGSLGMLPEKWLRQVESMRQLGGEADGEVIRLPSSQALLLDAMLAERLHSEVVVDRKFAAMRKRLQSFSAVTPVEAPKSFVGELRDYQKQGLAWLAFLRSFGLGGCLADDMGLGKTVQVLAMLASLPQPKKVSARRPSLIVAPRSVLGNWVEECRRFAPKLKVLDFSSSDRWRSDDAGKLASYQIVLTTYALMRADVVQFEELGMRFRYVILDEAQMIKNADSQSSKAARLLASEHRLALTGTPVENHLGELWSLCEFLNPGMLGRLPAFQALFGSDADAEQLRSNRELVQRALRPVLLRRTKAQVLKDLPAKTEQTIWCEMASPQRRRYDKLRDHYRKRLLDKEELQGKQRFVVLEALLRLRQAACHEGLLDKARRNQASAKFEALIPRLEQLASEGHKALIFSQFTSLLDLLEGELQKLGLQWQRIDGRTRKRAERIERFQNDPAYPIFLISLKAGGFGLNLTAASYVFLLDPWWNPAAEMQAVDRAHRIGQKRAVNAYRLVCRDTVEERVLELQDKKKSLYEAILGNERSLLQDLSREDLETLLR